MKFELIGSYGTQKNFSLIDSQCFNDENSVSIISELVIDYNRIKSIIVFINLSKIENKLSIISTRKYFI